MRKRIAFPGLIGLLCLSALAPPLVGADGKKKDKEKPKINVDFNVGWGGCYRPREWTPVTVGVTTPFEKAIDCVVQFSSPQDDLNALYISRREVFMPALPRDIHLVTRMDFAVNSAELTIRGTDTSFYWSRRYDLWNRDSSQRPLTAVEDHEVLIGLSGSQGFSIMQVPRASVSQMDSKQGRVHAAYRFQRLLPSDWTAYASLDLLVLYDVEWVELTVHQQRAVSQYVTNGGRLLMVLGVKPLPAGHTFAQMLPLTLGEPREIQLSRRDLTNWRCNEPKTDKVACWQVNMSPGSDGWAIKNDRNGNSIFVSGPVGFGKVGVLLFDPAAIGCKQGKQLTDFWLECMSPLMGRRSIERSNNPDNSNEDWSYKLGAESSASNAVLEYLYSVEELKPIHIGWVVLVLASLAVLIGPVDYLVLKAFGRLPWTWVTSTACIAVFSVGAYYGVEYLRGGVLQARVVSVVDSVDGREGAWATRYLGIFAPHSDDYRLSGLNRKQWWSGMAPTQSNEIYRYGFEERVGTRNIHCEQHIDGGNLPSSVPINIWSMQCLCSESHLAKAPLAATVRRGDDGQWTVKLRNNGETPIARAYMRVGASQAVQLDSVPAGESREFTGTPTKHRSWQDEVSRMVNNRGRHSRYSGREEDDGRAAGPVDSNSANRAAEFAHGVYPRTKAMMSYLEQGAVVVCAEYDNAPVPWGIEGKNCRFQHTLLARLVVFPEGRK